LQPDSLGLAAGGAPLTHLPPCHNTLIFCPSRDRDRCPTPTFFRCTIVC
jgi:hypothetical protein